MNVNMTKIVDALNELENIADSLQVATSEILCLDDKEINEVIKDDNDELTEYLNGTIADMMKAVADWINIKEGMKRRSKKVRAKREGLPKAWNEK